MFYILKKSKGSMVLEYSSKPIVDTYQSINLKPYYVNLYFKDRLSVKKKELPEIYEVLRSLIVEVNLLKGQVEVPNKVFRADKDGRSCLRRSPSTGVIYLSYRGKSGDKARTPNTCFLTDDPSSSRSSWVCMNTFNKSSSYYTNTPVYSIKPGHPDYEKWANYMDSEYKRLTGIKVIRVESKPIFKMTPERQEALGLCESAYCEVDISSIKNMFYTLAQKGLCSVNNKRSSLYDKYGHWICRFEEYPNGDTSEGEMINGVLNSLDLSELKRARKIIESFIDGGLFTNTSLFEI